MSTEKTPPILKRALIFSDLRIVGATVIALFAGGWAAMGAVDAKVDKRVHEVAAPLEAKIDLLSAALGDTRDEVVEFRKDIHSLYDYQKTGRAQPRLERK